MHSNWTHTLLLTLTLTLAAPAQVKTKKALAPLTLAQAVVVEVYEHDLGKAMDMYRKIAADDRQLDETRAQASLRLAKAFRRLGQTKEADATFREVAAGTGDSAKEAKAILSGAVQDDGDLVRAKVRQALTTMRLTGKPDSRDLIWIGQAAAPYVIKAVDEEKADLRFISNASRVLFKLGGSEVLEWIATTQKSKDVLRKRAVIKGYAGSNDKVRTAASRFANDADASVRLEVLNSPIVTRADQLIRMMDDRDAAVQSRALGELVSNWQSYKHEDPVATIRSILPRLAKLDTGLHRSSKGLAGFLNWRPSRLAATDANRRLLLRLITLRCLRGHGVSWPELVADAPANAFEKEVLEAAHAVASARTTTITDADKAMRRIIYDCLPHWNCAALPAVLQLAKLGYSGDGRLGPWVRKHGKAEHVAAVAAELLAFHTADLSPVCEWMIAVGTPKSVFAQLEKVADGIFTKIANKGTNLNSAQRAVMSAIVAIDSKESTDYIAHRLQDGWSTLYTVILRQRDSVPGLQAVLQRALVMEGSERAMHRELVLGELIRKYENPGDPRLFARAYELGVGVRRATSLQYPRGRAMSGPNRGLQLIMALQDNPAQQVTRMRRGTGECTLANGCAIVAACLATGERTAFEDFAAGLSSSPHIDFVNAALPHVLAAPPAKLSGRLGNFRFYLLSDVLRRCATTPVPVNCKPLVLAALQHADVQVRRAAAGYVPTPLSYDDRDVQRALLKTLDDADPECRESAVKKLSYTEADVPGLVTRMVTRLSDERTDTVVGALHYLLSKHPPVLARHIDEVLGSKHEKVRYQAAQFWLQHKGAEGFDRVGPLLLDSSLGNRHLLVAKMGSFMDLRAVPHLLQALKSSSLREAAQEMLKSIRFYHEEKSKWGRLMSGSGFTTASAAEALIKQVNASTNKKVRLAAIASLGTLGDAESLPFLVKLIGDGDAEIAEAAGAAVAKINARPGTAGKK